MTPLGATHTSDTYGVVVFWSKRFDFRGVESGERFDAWHYWSGKGWIRECCASSRHFKEI